MENRDGLLEIITPDRQIQTALRYLAKRPDDPQIYDDILAMMKEHMDAGEREYHGHNADLRDGIARSIRRLLRDGDIRVLDRLNAAYRRSLLMDARVDFDSFMLYLESSRPPEEQFYLPRRRVLRPIVRAFQMVHDGEIDLLTVSQPKRTGKAVPVDTKVLTPTGYARIGDLKVGDTVIAVSGEKTVVTGVYPQGAKRVYKVTFGETGKCRMLTEVECCGDHLWTVQTEEDRHSGAHRVMSTKELMAGTMRRGHDRHRNYSVDYVGPVQFEPRGELLIKPYTMGVFIAEGGLTGGGIRFSTGDDEVVERVASELPDRIRKVCQYDYSVVSAKRVTDSKGHPVKSYTASALVKYGLYGKHAYEKHIPEEYLYASAEDRLELLRGLFDSDGSVVANGCEYATTSERLANDVCFLVRGLGGRCRIVRRVGCYTMSGKKKETRTNYRLFCKFPNSVNPFYLRRKASLCNSKMGRLRHFIESIEETDEYKEMVCISVADESKQYVIGDSMIPTHNTTIGTWFVLFRAGNAPDGSSVCSGAGDMLVKSFYNGMTDVLTAKDKYLYYDVFPEAKLVQTNADEKTINLKSKKRFATITCRPIDGQITGSTEATPDGLVYLDDTVKNEEEAINRDRLDFLWDKVRGDILGRRLEGCPIVAQGTRYSLYDPIGRLQEVAPSMGWRTKVLEIPALDPVTDESNFQIVLHGKPMFTTAYYRHERELVTDMQWMSQFQQQPFEAKGRLFPEDELNRYFKLPDREPDAVVAACDTAEKGSDSVMLPVGYIYGDDVYIEDCVFSNATPEHTKPECANILMKHKVAMATFESNSTGEYYARDVERLIESMGGKVSIRLRRANAKKTTRIEVESDHILKHFYFKDKSLYQPASEYGQMMREFTTYTRNGKVPHDDAPDGMSLLSHEIRNTVSRSVEVIRRPW